MKPGVSLLFSMLVGGSILALVLALVGIPDILATLSSMDLKFLVAMFLIALLGRFLIAYRWSCILEAMGHHVPLLNLLWYYFTGFTFGYVLPSAQMGGEPVRAALLRLCRPANLAGLPAISVPCGFTSEGLPVGLQVIGPRCGEEIVLRLALAFEQAHSWHERHATL